MRQSITIEVDIPLGYEYVDFRVPKNGEAYCRPGEQSVNSNWAYAEIFPRIILKLIEPEIAAGQKFTRRERLKHGDNTVKILIAADDQICFRYIREGGEMEVLAKSYFMLTFKRVEPKICGVQPSVDSTIFKPGMSGFLSQDSETGKVTIQEVDS